MPIQRSRTKTRNGKVVAIMHLDPVVWEAVKIDALRLHKPVYQYAEEIFMSGLGKMKMKGSDQQLSLLEAVRDAPTPARVHRTRKRR
jgi:hypothetical protein